MTPPPGSPVNDFEDTHVMETRHPLTIPAAIVLGTAAVAPDLEELNKGKQEGSR